MTKGNRTGGARMLAVVTLHPGIQGRHYRLPTESDYQAVWKAQKRLEGDSRGVGTRRQEGPLPGAG